MRGSGFDSVEQFDIMRKVADEEMVDPAQRSAGGRRLIVGAADDPEERRADQFADHALDRLVGSALASSGPRPLPASTTRIRRSTRLGAVGRGGGDLDADTSTRLTSRIRRGAALAPEVLANTHRLDLGDLSDVRVHTDGDADTIARSMQADAFTVDRDVFFAAGHYRPDTREGSQLALHEFSHAAENGSSSGESIHRKISQTAADVDAVRAGKGKLASSLGMSKDGLDPIRTLLKAYHLSEKADQPWYAEQLTAACEGYLDAHRSKDRAAKVRRALVEEIYLHARSEHSNNQAQAEYVRATNTAPSLDAVKTGGLWNQDGHTVQGKAFGVHEGAAALASGETASGMQGAGTAALAQVEKLGLTHAEVLAIRTYTAGDFRYINSGMSSFRQTTGEVGPDEVASADKSRDDGQANWFIGVLGGRSASENMTDDEKAELDEVNRGRREGRSDPKGMPTDAKAAARWAAAEQLREEAGLHAGVLMQALAKMDDTACSTYRGSKTVPVGHDQVGNSFRFPAFTSTSTLEYKAVDFAKSSPTGVVYELDVKYGRDLSILSVFGSLEGEILLMPGAEFKVVSFDPGGMDADGARTMPRIKLVQLAPGTIQKEKEEQLEKLLKAGGSKAG